MLTNYNEFIFESLINESILVYSINFRAILTKITSPVAKALIDLEKNDINVSNNYIDISDKEHISFILDRRVRQLEADKDKTVTLSGGGYLRHSDANKNLFDALDYIPAGVTTYHPSSDEIGEIIKSVDSDTEKTYVKVKFENGISVVNKDSVVYVDIDKIAFSQNRQPIRIGRGVRSILNSAKLKFKDAEIESFVNLYKSEWDKMNDIFRYFELVKGDDIAEWYSSRKYLSQEGQLGNSCMRNVSKNFFDIYTKNEDKCQLLILRDLNDEDLIKGRAIVWKLDSPEITFMDRIYTNYDSDIELFKSYAKSKKWYCKVYNNSSSDNVIYNLELSKNEVFDDLQVILKKTSEYDYEKFPYLDTLKYFNIYSGKLTTDSTGSGNRGNVYTLEDTQGSYAEADECDECGGSGEVECGECEGSGNSTCGDCYRGRSGRSTGYEECSDCDGTGMIKCSDCDGNDESCKECEGSNKIACGTCDGDGEISCSSCDGSTEQECDNCNGSGSRSCSNC